MTSQIDFQSDSEIAEYLEGTYDIDRSDVFSLLNSFDTFERAQVPGFQVFKAQGLLYLRSEEVELAISESRKDWTEWELDVTEF